jgi:hypothetical protein
MKRREQLAICFAFITAFLVMVLETPQGDGRSIVLYGLITLCGLMFFHFLRGV